MAPDSIADLARREHEATPFAWSESQISKSLSQGHLCFTFGTRDKDFGYCVLLSLGQVIEILNLVIFHDFQGQGYGRVLMEKIKTFALGQGAETLWLEVRKGNQRARKLYRNAGFLQTGQRKNYFSSGQPGRSKEVEDALLMQCKL